ncbi:MAG: D-3-phosphoglycerate dehydrogenase, partial [uncultured Chloroflexia bacterium]
GVATVERWPGPGNPTPDVIAGAMERAEVLITGWGTPSLTMLEQWTPEQSTVRLVVHSAGTVKQLVPVTALERGLKVTHSNESLAEAVAEWTLGAIIMARRDVFAAATRFRTGDRGYSHRTMHEVRGSVVGIIGASAVGRRMMKLLAPLGVTLLLADPFSTPEMAATFGAQLVELPELLRSSDTVTLHAPVTPSTIGMLGAAEFAMMKDGSLFVNTARGRLIDHDALLHELQTGRISALLDVTDPTEPLPKDSPFFALDNCVVLPHIAGVSSQARMRQGRYSVEETIRYLSGEPLRFQVTRDRWDSMA